MTGIATTWAGQAPPWDVAPGAGERGRAVRDVVFLLAIVLLNVTLFRPSPVDVAFSLAFALTLFSRQRITPSALLYFGLVAVWLGSMFHSSIDLLDDEEVTYQVTKIGFAASIGLCACLISIHWSGTQFRRFLRVWIFSAMVAATLGTIGFAGNVEVFTWDGRAKGLFDDPNMYGAFLIPGLVGAVHFLFTGGRRWLYAGCILWLTLGLLLSFSRVAIAAALLLSFVLMGFLNRRTILKTVAYTALAAVALGVVGLCAAVLIDGFDDKVFDRFTLAKDYDLGERGRLGGYLNSINLILASPGGLGLLQYERMFPEPIHNIWISSFMNYGWPAGFAWSFLVTFAIMGGIRNFRATRDPVCITILLAWLGIAACSMLHEAERWRHLWLMTGLVWGMNHRSWLPQRLDVPGPASRRVPLRPAAPAPGGESPPGPGPATGRWPRRGGRPAFQGAPAAAG